MNQPLPTPPACIGIFGLLFGHKFEARYSTGAPNPVVTDYGLDMLEATKQRTYCGDVCSRCGKRAEALET